MSLMSSPTYIQFLYPAQIHWYESDYVYWFRENYKNLGFEEIHRCYGYPDFFCVEQKTGKTVGVELELFPSKFLEHKHDPSKVDYIYCADDDRVFYPPLPKKINDKIVISGLLAYKEKKCWLAIEEICERYIEGGVEEAGIRELMNVLSWLDPKRLCVICKKKIPKGQKGNSESVLKEHKFCVNTFIDNYLDYRGLPRKNSIKIFWGETKNIVVPEFIKRKFERRQ